MARAMGRAMARALTGRGWSGERLMEMRDRIAVFDSTGYPTPDGPWIVEWVATVAEHRGKGLVQRLLEAEFARGRDRGHPISQISILSGNTAAQRAYERAGYRYVDERRSAAFEQALGCPGLLRMLKSL